ncbi:MAG: DUF6786 family protein, partial [Patescibacteria group bacterium]|nr:DUF6786 family protein [Patescibacteria group bacterium]
QEDRDSFGADVRFLSQHTEVRILGRGDARIALAPAYQGRVMTSTTGGMDGPSFGWLNYKVIEGGILPPDARKGRLEDHIFIFGGEERFWMGPEGGQYSIFFAPGTKFDFEHWRTPAFLDTDPFQIAACGRDSARFTRRVETRNYSGAEFTFDIDRTVTLLDHAAVEGIVGSPLAETVSQVAYETDNRVTNRGAAPWTRGGGLLSIWLLGMYKPGPRNTMVIPFRPGPESELGPKVNDAYFGKVPPNYLVVKDNVLFFKGDGAWRGKIGISTARSLGIAGSYDADLNALTLVTYNVPTEPAVYVNSMWEWQADPYRGDAINAYNDGSPAPGQPPLGPFYELETSSPAVELAPGATLRHVQRTVHLQGPQAALDAIARTTLGVGLRTIEEAFA